MTVVLEASVGAILMLLLEAAGRARRVACAARTGRSIRGCGCAGYRWDVGMVAMAEGIAPGGCRDGDGAPALVADAARCRVYSKFL